MFSAPVPFNQRGGLPLMKFKTKAAHIRYLAANRKNWSYGQIARAVGCDISHVSHTLDAAGRPQSWFVLGKEASRAGLTVQDIRAIARERGAAQ
jgi:hypothetical protein